LNQGPSCGCNFGFSLLATLLFLADLYGDALLLSLEDSVGLFLHLADDLGVVARLLDVSELLLN
jgi:hypothetical protein